jgi:hypothetical protein
LEGTAQLLVGANGSANGARIELGQPLFSDSKESAVALRQRFRDALHKLGNGHGIAAA